MLKMYNSQNHAGDSPEFWEENWESSEFEESIRFMSVDPLRPLFEKYLRPDSLMLEGGCGMGNYIAYYAERGFNVIGLDFAQRALKTLRKRRRNLKLCGGDVSNLPFADKTIDLYYSGGVVEHFEGGAAESLREARRVLKEDGVLLISVPYYSPLRRVLSPLRRDNWCQLSMPTVDGSERFKDKKFFQYAYRTGEFGKMLADAGLKTIEIQGYAVLWGLYELPFIYQNGGEFSHSAEAKAQTEPREFDVAELIRDPKNSLLRRLVVNEDASIPVLGLGVRVMRWAASNMMMYVCVRD